MNNVVLEKNPDTSTAAKARRSTRLLQAVHMNVSGQSISGNVLSEATSAMAVNCHGCVYSSRYEYRAGAWVTVQVLSQQINGSARPVRAQVKFVRLPRSPRELYQVGVEFESPANIWGIQSPPQDWLPFSQNGAANGKASNGATSEVGMTRTLEHDPGTARDASVLVSTPASPSRLANLQQTSEPGPLSNGDKSVQALAPDLLQHALEGMLQRAAEKAVASALSSRLSTAVNKAASAIENFSRASVRRVEEHCDRTRETLETSVRQNFVAVLQSDITAAEEQLRKQVEKSLAKAQQGVQLLETVAEEIVPRIASAHADLQSSARELEGQFSARLRETLEGASAEFRNETIRVSNEQRALWHEKTKAAVEIAEEHLKERTAEAHTRLDTVAGQLAAKLQSMAEDQTSMVDREFREKAKAALSSFGAETRAEWDARQRACQEDVARLSRQEIEQCRQRLEKILNSAMSTAISTANEHSRILFDSLLKGTAEQLAPTNGAAAAHAKG